MKHRRLASVFLELMLHMFSQAFDIVQYLHFFVQMRRRRHSREKPFFLEAHDADAARAKWI